MTIRFKEIEKHGFWGRNGMFSSSALHISHMDKYVRITPITSKGKGASCFIDVPDESLQDLIKELIKMYQETL